MVSRHNGLVGDYFMKLFAPEAYWNAPRAEIDRIAGGCGPGRIGDKLIPDSLLGASIKEACRIHDYMYHVGATVEDKKEADRVFLNNMLRIIFAGAKFFALRYPRIFMAYVFYRMVKEFGGPAFWKSKNSPDEEREYESV